MTNSLRLTDGRFAANQPIYRYQSPTDQRLDEIEFAENPEPRCPCVLLLDTSGSMHGAPIEALNHGLQLFRDELMRDSLASRRVEVAVVAFDSDVRIVQDFVTVDQFMPPILATGGATHMGRAINTALDMVENRKLRYRDHGIAYYRPWVFMITDGEPQGESEDVIDKAARRVRENELSKRVAFFAVGVENADMERLQQIAVRAPVKLIGLRFTEMFLWLSASMQSISHSQVDDQIALPPPGWGTV